MNISKSPILFLVIVAIFIVTGFLAVLGAISLFGPKQQTLEFQYGRALQHKKTMESQLDQIEKIMSKLKTGKLQATQFQSIGTLYQSYHEALEQYKKIMDEWHFSDLSKCPAGKEALPAAETLTLTLTISVKEKSKEDKSK